MIEKREKREKIKTKKLREAVPRKMLLKIKKKDEKSFLRTALMLCLRQIIHRILSGLADRIFSGEKQKVTKFARFANKTVTNNICKCHILAEKCEYYKNKIESFGA